MKVIPTYTYRCLIIAPFVQFHLNNIDILTAYVSTNMSERPSSVKNNNTEPEGYRRKLTTNRLQTTLCLQWALFATPSCFGPIFLTRVSHEILNAIHNGAKHSEVKWNFANLNIKVLNKYIKYTYRVTIIDHLWRIRNGSIDGLMEKCHYVFRET